MFNNKLLNLKVIFMLDGKSIHTSVSINVFLNIEAIYYGFLNTEVAYSFKTLISTLKKFHDRSKKHGHYHFVNKIIIITVIKCKISF